ncbi:unnamed protein product [Rhizopus stolonifer]
MKSRTRLGVSLKVERIQFYTKLQTLHQIILSRVGKINVVGLSSIVVKDVLRLEMKNGRYNSITKKTKFEPVKLFNYAIDLRDALNEAPLSLHILRRIFYDNLLIN